MAAAQLPRKLAAIVSIDVAGYSALAERDEAAAAACVARLRVQAGKAARAHGGRIFNTAGDGAMLEFASASDALEAAFRLCRQDHDPPLRLGVHLGEVLIADDGDLLGHGVNVAARLQAEAAPGGMLISHAVHDAVGEALAKRFTPRGRIKPAKMRATLGVFAWAPQGAPSMATAGPPVLAVLPFDNASRERDMRFFSDGVSEEILYVISRLRGIKVIGSTSSFAFRGRDKPKAAKALGATHILDGSVRRSVERVRISMQLTEADTGVVLWSERYERDLADMFALQEDIARDVASALTLALTEARRVRAVRLDAALFDAYLRARAHLKSGAPARVAEAARMLEAIVSEAPDFARAWSALALARLERLRIVRAERARLAEAAREAAERAIGADAEIGEAYAVLAALESEHGRWAEREALLERALVAEPNNAFLRLRHGQFLVSVGRVCEGYAEQARAFELDPLDPMLIAFHGHNVWAARSRAEGRAMLDEAARRFPDNVFLWYMRLNLAALDGDFALASALREDGLRLVPALEDSALYKSGAMLQAVMAAPSPEAFMQLGADFTAMAEAQPSSALDLAVALAVLGMTGPALAIFERALDDIEAWRLGAPDALRPHVGYETALLFIEATGALRMDAGFARLCARLGLVRYWREAERWPDCAAGTPYDFQAECARHA